MIKKTLLKNNYNYDALEMNDMGDDLAFNYKSIHDYTSIHSFSNQLHRNDIQLIYGGNYDYFQ